MIRGVLFKTGKASRRIRRLPAERIVWLIIAQALFRARSIQEVTETLEIARCRTDNELPPAKSAVANAQARLGDAPLEDLFKTTSAEWAQMTCTQNTIFGLALLSMDGTTLKLPDSEVNRSTFGAQVYPSGVLSSYPQARVLTLTTLHSRMITEVEFGHYNINEMRYAEVLEERIPDHSLTLVDKGFFSAAILVRILEGGTNRHFIIPARAGTRGIVISGDHEDYVLRMNVTREARQKHPDLPRTWELRAVPVTLSTGETLTLLTSLLDSNRYPREDIAALAKKRWEVETSFGEVKQTLLDGELTLRTRSPEKVRQEIWGFIIAYNLVRLQMAHLAASTNFLPTELSFTRALNLFRDELLVEVLSSKEGQAGVSFHRRRRQLFHLPHQKRPGRKNPRVVKHRPARYHEKVLRVDPS